MAGRRIVGTVLGFVASVGVGFAASGLSGCATYANYPPIGDDLAVNNPNVRPIPLLMELSLLRVVAMTPVDGAYVINFPEGMTRRDASRVATSVGSDRAMLVGDAGTGARTPTFHVSRVWLRGDRAEVDVVRPALSGASHQPVTVRLVGGVRGWRVDSTKVWPIGLGEAPALHGFGDPAPGPGPVESASVTDDEG